MTEKEVIIVDGVNVLECDEYYIEQVTDQVKCSLSGRYCEENKNCLFKQLARKTQECEELKKQVVRCSEGWGKADCEKNWYQQAEQAKQEENHDLTMKLYSYRKALEEIKEYTRKQFCDNCEDIGSTEYNCHCEYCEYQEYFDIISGFADGRSETSPDSEQIEHTVAEAQMRNSVSVEQIQDSKAKEGD